MISKSHIKTKTHKYCYFIMVVGILLLANPLIALFVGMDAHKRETDEGFFFILVLVTGIVGAIIYLLVRPDTIVPIEEREFGLLGSVLWIAGLYFGAAVGGLVISIIFVSLGGEIAREIGVLGENTDLTQTLFTNLFLMPVLLAPVGLHFYRNPKRVEQARSLYEYAIGNWS